MRKITNAELGRITPDKYDQAHKIPVTVILDNIRSANNVGSFFRTADAFGVSEIILLGISATPPSKDIHKTALGAELIIPWRHFADRIQAMEILAAEGLELIAVEQVEGAVSLEKFEVNNGCRYGLIFGNEVDGVSQQIVDLVNSAIEIPQIGTKHSLNVAVTGGAVIWEFFRKLEL